MVLVCMPLGHLFSSCVRSAKRHPPPPRPLAHSPWLQELELALNEITPDGDVIRSTANHRDVSGGQVPCTLGVGNGD